MSHARRLTPTLLALTLACASCFGAIVTLAVADDYHTTCVPHGYVHGASQSDGSFFGRVDSGCGSAWRSCDLYVWGSFVDGYTVGNSTCNAWSRDFGTYSECPSTTHTTFSGVFNEHIHKASDWCG